MTASQNFFTLFHLWQHTIRQAVSLIADNCNISIPQVNQSLPALFTTIQYQLATIINHDDKYIKVGEVPNFTTLLQQIGMQTNLFKQGINFITIPNIMPILPTITHQLFSSDSQRYMILGMLMTKTHLPFDKLALLFQWVTTLTLVALADFAKYTQSTVNEKQFLQWIVAQPILMADEDDVDVIVATGFKSDSTLTQRLSIQEAWLKHYPDNLPTDLKWLPKLSENMANFINTRPFAIVPGCSVIQTTKNFIHPAISPATRSQDIFAVPTIQQPQWVERLQKHWIATAVIFSTLVFGAISIIMGPSKPNEKAQTATSAIQKPVYTDVAIVRVASSTDAITSLASAPSIPASSVAIEKPKVLPKKEAVKTDKVTKSDMKQSDNKKTDKDKLKQTKSETKKSEKGTSSTKKSNDTVIQKTPKSMPKKTTEPMKKSSSKTPDKTGKTASNLATSKSAKTTAKNDTKTTADKKDKKVTAKKDGESK